MRVTAILFPGGRDGYTVVLPALPGCLSEGNTRDEALANAREAALGWLQAEEESGRGPVAETAALLAEATTGTLSIIDEMRREGELPLSAGFPLELVSLDVITSSPV